MKDQGDFKANRQKLAAQLKDKPINTPLQEVKPVEPPKVIEPINQPTKQAHVNFWVEYQLLHRLKLLALKNGTTLREIGTQALEEYLKRNE